MITPLTSDADWLARFARTPLWQPDIPAALVLAPHPDDETLGAGGLIASLTARGVPVKVIAATDGENAYDTPGGERLILGRIREDEQMAALARLGVPAKDIIRLRLADSGLHQLEGELTQRLLHIVHSLAATLPPGTVLVAPWSGDFHPDHIACARAAAAVAKNTGLSLVSYFFWTWHRGWPELLDAEAIVRFVPDAASLLAKSEALELHRSQLAHPSLDPILPRDLLGPAHWPFEIFLPAKAAA